MGIMVYSLLWVMQDFVHQPYDHDYHDHHYYHYSEVLILVSTNVNKVVVFNPRHGSLKMHRSRQAWQV